MRAFAQGLVGDTPNTLPQIEAVVKNILGVATSLIGLGIFAMFVVGAFRLLTSGSNQEQKQKAWQTFTFAAMGGAAVILVWLVFVFLKEFTGLDLLKFSICITGNKDDPFCGL
jgi:hypothetical protein